ncbi:MAG: hypothetical protein AAGM22_11295 [Acidobacteriota bacterium]
MVIGINTVYEFNGRSFHLQAEDLGIDAKVFEVRIYDKGSVLWQKRMAYDDLLADDLPKSELEQALRAKMEKTLRTVEAAIAKGKIG